MSKFNSPEYIEEMQKNHALLIEISKLLKCNINEVPNACEDLLEEVNKLENYVKKT